MLGKCRGETMPLVPLVDPLKRLGNVVGKGCPLAEQPDGLSGARGTPRGWMVFEPKRIRVSTTYGIQLSQTDYVYNYNNI